jgi:hypothetical protein
MTNSHQHLAELLERLLACTPVTLTLAGTRPLLPMPMFSMCVPPVRPLLGASPLALALPSTGLALVQELFPLALKPRAPLLLHATGHHPTSRLIPHRTQHNAPTRHHASAARYTQHNTLKPTTHLARACALALGLLLSISRGRAPLALFDVGLPLDLPLLLLRLDRRRARVPLLRAPLLHLLLALQGLLQALHDADEGGGVRIIQSTRIRVRERGTNV